MAGASTVRIGFLRAVSQPSRLAFGVGILAAASGAATYAILTGLIPYTPNGSGLIALLLINLTLGLSLGALIAWRLVRLWAERRSGRAGAKLHVRLVTWFSAIAVVPAILVAIFAAVTLNLGLEAWFSARVKDALGSAVNVARVYVNDHAGSIESDAVAISNLLQQDPTLFDENHHVRAVQFISRLSTLTKDRGLRAAYILDSHGVAIISTQKPGVDDPKPVPARDLADARRQVVIDARAEDGKITALIRMQSLNDAYLMVMRTVDPKVFNYYRRTRDAVSEYNRLDQNRMEVQLVFAAMYAVVSLVILLAAVWSGLWAANRLVRPISSLIDAAERVSEGDLEAQVRGWARR